MPGNDPTVGVHTDPVTPLIEHLEDIGRFRVVQDGRQVAELDYRSQPGVWNIVHTYADPVLRGTGLASQLVRHVMDQARAEGLKIIPSCPYIPVWLRMNPDYLDLVAGR